MQEQGLDPGGKMSFPVRTGLPGNLEEMVVRGTQSPSWCEPHASQHGVKAAEEGRVGPAGPVRTWGRGDMGTGALGDALGAAAHSHHTRGSFAFTAETARYTSVVSVRIRPVAGTPSAVPVGDTSGFTHAAWITSPSTQGRSSSPSLEFRAEATGDAIKPGETADPMKVSVTRLTPRSHRCVNPYCVQ